MFSSPIDIAAMDSAGAPERKKLTVQITPDKQAGRLHVSLALVLTEDGGAEQHARERFGEILDVEYTIDVDLDAERKEFVKQLNMMYQGDVGERLRRPEATPLSELQLKQFLKPFASQGKSIFSRMFHRLEGLRGVADVDIEVVQAAIRAAWARPQLIHIRSPAPLFPWSLLYGGQGFTPDNLSTLEPRHFWGFRHEIQEAAPGLGTSSRIRLPAVPHVGAAVCSTVDGANRHRAPGHPFTAMGDDRVHFLEDVTCLGGVLANFQWDCFYFYGHAHHDDQPVPSASWLKLRDVQLTVSQLGDDYNAPRFQRELVVAFLNGCGTAPLQAWTEATVVGFLCLRGQNRLCCVASVGNVPEGFAALFAESFWRRFLIERQPIGRAVLEARVELLEPPSNNPLGLLYTVFGKLDTRVVAAPTVAQPATLG